MPFQDASLRENLWDHLSALVKRSRIWCQNPWPASRIPLPSTSTKGGGGETAQRETRALLEFVAEASPQVSLSFHSLEEGPSAADFRSSLGVSHGPVVAIEGTADRGPFLFYGFPERKELKPFLDGVVIASGVTATLPAEVEIFLAALQRETVIRIFTAPD